MYFEAESEGIKYQVSVSESKSHWRVGMREEEKDWEYFDIRKADYSFFDDTVSFLFNNSSYLLDVLNKGTEYTVYTRGVFKTFKVYNEEALLHESLKAGGGMGAGLNLSSGMPGKIVKIFVKPGDVVKAGDPLLIMEAMKMENEMRAVTDVTIKEVLVKEGENVESGAELVTFLKEKKIVRYTRKYMKHTERKEQFKTSSGIDLKRSYSNKDWNASDKLEANLGEPGKYPYTRGVQDTMYRGRLWTMRQYAGFGSAKESNERYKMLLKKGTTGLSVAFDLPTQMGYDSDHIMATGEVGKVGVAISSIEDMEVLLADLPLKDISTSMTINSTAGILLALYIAVAKKRGVALKDLNGTVQNDLLKEYIARGTYIYPPKPSLRIITDIFKYCTDNVPGWNTISISGYHIREAGSTAVQEVAFTLANGLTYVQAAIDRGLNVDEFAARLSFFFNVHNNFFEEIAKFRAARRMWARFMKERFKATNLSALKMRFHSQVAGSTLTAQQPENNIVRVALQAMASVLGGTQSLHTNSMDEALGLPTEKAATIALRTQQIIAHETGVADVVDPLGGSFYIESLTDEIEKRALEYIERIEGLGGVVSCVESGWIQNEIQNASYQFQKDLESRKEIVVGVNEFVQEEKPAADLLKVSEQVSIDQITRLKAFKAKRDPAKVEAQLAKVRAAAGSDQNLMPVFIEAVENNVTLGEIAEELRKVFGLFKESITL